VADDEVDVTVARVAGVVSNGGQRVEIEEVRLRLPLAVEGVHPDRAGTAAAERQLDRIDRVAPAARGEDPQEERGVRLVALGAVELAIRGALVGPHLGTVRRDHARRCEHRTEDQGARGHQAKELALVHDCCESLRYSQSMDRTYECTSAWGTQVTRSPT